jgi:hypothetical protein
VAKERAVDARIGEMRWVVTLVGKQRAKRRKRGASVDIVVR